MTHDTMSPPLVSFRIPSCPCTSRGNGARPRINTSCAPSSPILETAGPSYEEVRFNFNPFPLHFAVLAKEISCGLKLLPSVIWPGLLPLVSPIPSGHSFRTRLVPCHIPSFPAVIPLSAVLSLAHTRLIDHDFLGLLIGRAPSPRTFSASQYMDVALMCVPGRSAAYLCRCDFCAQSISPLNGPLSHVTSIVWTSSGRKVLHAVILEGFRLAWHCHVRTPGLLSRAEAAGLLNISGMCDVTHRDGTPPAGGAEAV